MDHHQHIVDVSRSPTECPLCYENYTMEGDYQPRMVIPCGHTVCFTCINRLSKEAVMTCPICRKKCPHRFITETGFPINYLAIALLENAKKEREKDSSRASSASDVTRSPKMPRAKSAQGHHGAQGGAGENENECSDCRRHTDKLSYCFHCASPVCEECRIQHTEGVVGDLEKQANLIQDQKRSLVKKIEALHKLISSLDDNCTETETEIDDNFTIIQHEVTEAKSRLLESLTTKFQAEKQRLQNYCEQLTEALEKAGTNELPEIVEKNVSDITANEIALLCEHQMSLVVSSRNMKHASRAVKMKHAVFNFAHNDKLAKIRTSLQKFGAIKVEMQHPKPEEYQETEDESLSELGPRGDADDTDEDTRRILFGDSIAESDPQSSDDEDTLRRNRSLSSSQPRPSHRPTATRASGGAKAKARAAKLTRQGSSNASSASLMRSASMSVIDDQFSDESSANPSRKSSVGVDNTLPPPPQNYASLKEKYESIRGPVGSLVYRNTPKGGVLDVVARYRTNGFVVADNNEYKVKAYNSNWHTSISFSYRLGPEDVPFVSGIAATADKMFLLVDSKNKYVRMFDRKGNHVRDLGKDLFQRPKDVCTDDIEIFVTDSGASCIQVFDMQGAHLRTMGGPGSGDGEFLWPAGMKMSSEGKLVVCDCNNNRLQYITKDGDHISNLSALYGAYSALRPTCVDVDKENNVIVLFAESRRVKIYNKEGHVINDFRVEDELNSVAVTADGLIALVDGSKTGKCFIY